MKHARRLCAALLTLVMLIALLPVPYAAADTAKYNGVSYSTDYTKWKQAAPAWGPTALGDVHTMSGSGCLITAIAMLMCHSGAYDPASLNPGIFRDWLDGKECISHSEDRSKDALLSFGRITSAISPRFYFVNQEFFQTSTPFADVTARVSELMAAGYYVVARVQYSGHFVALGNVAGADVRIFDSGVQNKKLLSEYDGSIGGLIYFKANLSGKDTILPGHAAPTRPAITNFRDTWGDGDDVILSWTGSSHATHYNVYVEQKQADGSWKANYRTYAYVSPGMKIPALPAGTYRVFAQAANSNTNPWTYANSDYKTFTVKKNSLTVTYDPNGGTASKTSQFAIHWGAYELPTVTRSKGGFLGWYTSSGKLLTKDSYIYYPKAHTITAKWDMNNHGLHKTLTYNNQFKDVSKNAWYRNNVAEVYAYGLMNGVDATHFDPNAQITAGQAVILAARTHKLYTTGSSTFATTKPWIKAYSDYCVSKGILTSVPADMNATLTRQEFAAIIANALPASALPAVNTVAQGAIPDVYRSDAAIYKLYRAGIFIGSDSKGTFKPNNPITRAEVATILVRMADPSVRELFTLTK